MAKTKNLPPPEAGVEELSESLGIDTELDEETKRAADELAASAPKRQPKAKKQAPVEQQPSKKEVNPFDMLKEATDDMDGEMLEDMVDVDFLHTGHIGIDYIMSGKFVDGGYPRGRIIEVYGESQSGKSLMAHLACATMGRMRGLCGLADSEEALNPDFLIRQGAQPRGVFVLKPQHKGDLCLSLEKYFVAMSGFVKRLRSKGYEGPIFLGFDSIAASPSFHEWEMLMSGKQVPEDQGKRAKVVSAYLRSFTSLIAESDVTLMFINQLRESPNVWMGPKEKTTSGRALPYYSDVRLRIDGRKLLTMTGIMGKQADDEGEQKFKAERKLGATFVARAEKTRQTSPHRWVSGLEFWFEAGIGVLSGLFDLMLTDQLLMPTSAGSAWYTWVDRDARHVGKIEAQAGAGKFQRREFENLDFILDNYQQFGAESRNQLAAILHWGTQATEYGNNIRQQAKAGKIKTQEQEEGPKTLADSPVVRKLVKEHGGGIVLPKATVPEDEIG